MSSRRPILSGAVTIALAAAVVAGCATSPSAYRNRDEPINRTTASDPLRGTVHRVDEPQRVVVLEDGRMYRVTDEQAVMVNGQPVVLGRVQPGTPVTIGSGTPVVYQGGRYVAVEPGATTVVAVPASGRIVRLHGEVTDVERNGNVKVRLPGGEDFEFRPPVGTIAREGDPVTIDMTFGAPPPSALPR